MPSRGLQLLAQLFLAAYTLDGALSLVDEVVRAGSGSSPLVGPRNLLAAGVWYAALLVFVALLLTPRIPTLVFLTLVLSTLWLNLGAAPLPLLLRSGTAFGLSAAALQLVLGAGAFFWLRRRSGTGAWTERTAARPAFSLRHTLGFAALALLVLAPLGAAYLLVWLATSTQVASNGFVSFDLYGVSVDDRRYARADREIRLVGMMHIGEETAYAELVRSFVRDSTVVLAEGVSDEEGVLQEHLAYEPAAQALGLSPQDDLERYLAESAPDGEAPEWPVVRHADLDASEFSPTTIEFLDWAATLWSSDGVLAALSRIRERPAHDPDWLRVVWRDIFELRNRHLLAEIDAALEDYECVVVPWGALHLPAIEQAVTGDGFVQTGATRRRLISWPTIGLALF
jgi:hypothetical protein